MRFLLDAQLPRRLAHRLTTEGHDALHTLDLPAGNRTEDTQINALSKREKRVVITKDMDFVDTFLLRRTPWKLLLVATGNIGNQRLVRLFEDNLDEIVEARKDTTVILHPLCDDRRTVYLDKTAEVIKAPPEFMLVVSFNPGYQNLFKNLKQSTRQRFVSLTFDFPELEQEIQIVATESGVSGDTAEKLVKLGRRLREVEGHDIEETASTRLLVHAAHMIHDGLDPRSACDAALVDSLTDDPVIREGLLEIVHAYFS